jgi:hypothetical protein
MRDSEFREGVLNNGVLQTPPEIGFAALADFDLPSRGRLGVA